MTQTSALPTDAVPTRLSRALMAPGARLMFALTMRAKLLLLAALLMVPMTALVGMRLHEQWQLQAQASQRLQGSDLAERLLPLLLGTQKHRGLTQRVLGGDTAAEGLRQEVRHMLKLATGKLDSLLAARPPGPLHTAWQPLRADLLGLAEGRHPTTAAASFAHHSRVVDAVRQLSLLNGAESGLLMDPLPRSRHLADLLVNSLPTAMETAAVARGLGGGLLARGQATLVERAAVLGRAAQMRRDLTDLDSRAGLVARDGASTLQMWPPARDSLVRLADQMDTQFNTDPLQGSAAEYFDTATSALDRLQGMANETGVALAPATEGRAAGGAAPHAGRGWPVRRRNAAAGLPAAVAACQLPGVAAGTAARHRGHEPR